MKILAISYSQTGQLDQITNNFLLPLKDFEIDRIQIKPLKSFPFPWTSATFFNAMPETVLEEPIELEPIFYKYPKYDLIILAYQPWYLSPSLPISSLLQDSQFKKIVSNTPIVTLIGARNMWINSQKSIAQHVLNAGGQLVGNVPLIDKNSNIISAVTILYWMLSGKKERFLNILPKPGVSDLDIDEVVIFGEILNKCIKNKSLYMFQSHVLELNMINIEDDILFIELRAKKFFRIWAAIIKKYGTSAVRRRFCVNAYMYYLLIALFIVAPIVFLFYKILLVPFTFKSIKLQKQYICSNKF